MVNLQVAECPECAAELPAAGDVLKGEIMTCPDCGAELEVTGVKPLSFALAPKVEEDWGE